MDPSATSERNERQNCLTENATRLYHTKNGGSVKHSARPRGPHAKKYGSASIEGGSCRKIAPTGLGRGRSPPNSPPTATRPQTTPSVLASAAADRHQLSRNVTCRTSHAVKFVCRKPLRQATRHRPPAGSGTRLPHRFLSPRICWLCTWWARSFAAAPVR